MSSGARPSAPEASTWTDLDLIRRCYHRRFPPHGNQSCLRVPGLAERTSASAPKLSHDRDSQINAPWGSTLAHRDAGCITGERTRIVPGPASSTHFGLEPGCAGTNTSIDGDDEQS